MIKLSPIHKNIRNELHLRIQALSRKKPLVNESRSEEIFSRTDYMARTPWMRMVSLVDTNSILEKNDDGSILKYVGGGLSGAVINGGFLKRQEIIESSRNPVDRKQFKFLSNKQMYGVNLRDDSTQTSKFTQLHAPIPGISEIVVEYKGGLKAMRTATITWEVFTLEDLDLLLPHFLTPGRNVILEWGWMYPNRIQSSASKYNLKDIFSGGTVTIDSIYENAHEFSFKTNGNQESMIGIIKGFNWTLRDDGGFDCTTELVTVGVNIFDQPLRPSTNVNIDIKKESETGDSKRSPRRPTFTEFLKSASNIIITKYTGKESQIKLDTNYNAFIISGEGPLGISQQRMLYVSWGWFEDNILSKFIGKFAGETVIGQVRSYDINEDGTKVSVQILNHEYLHSPALKKFVLPGQVPLITKNNNLESPFARAIYKEIKEGFKNFANPGDASAGYLRNILLSWDLIVDAFQDQVTVPAGMKRLYNKLNEEVGIWNLQFINDTTDPNTFKTVDMNIVGSNLKTILYDELRTINKKDNIGNPERELFVFPGWSSDSIVINQTMDVSLPNQMAIAAMYGANLNKTESNRRIGSPDIVAFSSNELPAVDSLQASYVDGAIDPIQLGSEVDFFGNITADLNTSLISDRSISVFIPDPKVDPNMKDETVNSFEIDNTLFSFVADFFDRRKQHRKTEKKKKTINEKSQLIHDIKNPESATLRHFYDIDGTLYNQEPTPVLETMKSIINPDTRDGGTLFLEPFDLGLEIDGISGILPGNIFTSSYLPSRYKKQVVFQIYNVSQTINTSWSTFISGKIRYIFPQSKVSSTRLSPKNAAELEVETPRVNMRTKEWDGPGPN